MKQEALVSLVTIFERRNEYRTNFTSDHRTISTNQPNRKNLSDKIGSVEERLDQKNHQKRREN